MNLIEYPDRDSLMMGLADRMASQLRQGLQSQDRVSFAGAGGTTPGPVYDYLSAVAIDWARVTVLPGDERWVDESSPRSNAAQLRSRLLQGRAAQASLQPLYTGDDTPEAGVGALNAQVRPLLPLSVVLLGMGDDMHTASLFPGGDGLEAALAPDAPPVCVIHAAAAGEPRISLSASALRSAMNVHILITGAQKRAAIQRARDLPELQAPVRAVMDKATIHWAE